MTLTAHRNAVMDFLSGPLDGAVFKSYSVNEGEDPRPERYAVVFIALSRRDQARYSGRQTRDVYTVTVHCVGESEDHALWVQDQVNPLTDKVLTVPGRTLWPVEFATGISPDLDDDLPTPLWFGISQFTLTSDPA